MEPCTLAAVPMFNALLSIGIYVGLVSAMAVVLATIMPRELDHDWPDDDR